ncbi:LexA family protein [Cohnella sp. GCM10020058]|uniref:LexA family protein n=1 Tax=Cohnella sp. GCM10020058 TaxID=3317330 RepID=UPI003645675A
MTRQAAILEFIRSFIAQHGYAPTLREIAAGVGVGLSGNVHRYVHHLRDIGKITFDDHKPRTIRIK